VEAGIGGLVGAVVLSSGSGSSSPRDPSLSYEGVYGEVAVVVGVDGDVVKGFSVL
jgi:hypothetical protein